MTICTPARDAAQLLGRYRAQIARLVWPPEQVRVIVCEGDSADDTAAQLQAWAATDSRVTVVDCTTGQPHYSSIVHPGRFALLARVFNAALAAVDLAWTDYVLFLPVDICYEPDLLARLQAHHVAIVAPLVFRAGVFYDIWAFSRESVAFPPFARAETAQRLGADLVRMDTVGGTVLLSRAVLQAGVRYTTDQVDRGLCAQAQAAGFTIWADPSLWVEHP